MTMQTDTESAATTAAAPVVRFERDGDLGTIVLANPPLNLLGGELGSGFHDALDQVIGSGVRAVLLRAEGPNFSGDRSMSKYQDIVEIVDDNHWILRSCALGEDGKWVQFMEGHYRRV